MDLWLHVISDVFQVVIMQLIMLIFGYHGLDLCLDVEIVIEIVVIYHQYHT